MKEKLIDFVNDWQNVLTDDELEKIVIILVKSLEENDKMQLSIKHQQLQEFILDKLENGNKQTKWLYETLYKL